MIFHLEFVVPIWTVIVVMSTLFPGFSPNPLSPENSCHLVRQLYHHHQHHHNHHHLGSHKLSNCLTSINPTSCCYGLDDAIAHKALEDFNTEINSLFKISTFEHQFIQYYNRIYEKLDSILNDTMTQVSETSIGQQRIIVANRNLIHFIREVIFESKHHSPNQLTRFIDPLLEGIFIDVLQRTQQKEYPPEYESCLLNTLKDSDMLSKTRDEMIIRFTRTISTANLIVHSLQNSLQLINQTNQMKMSTECVRRLASTFHCHRCHTSELSTNIEPCYSVCHQTITECLDRSLLESMDMIQKGLINTFDQLVNLMVDFFNPEIMVSAHKETIERAKEMIRSKSDKIAKNARTACGSLKRYIRSATNVATNNAYDYYNYSTPNPNEDVTPGFSLYVSIQSVSHLFAQHKDMFINLDRKICDQFSDHNCWNGTDVVKFYQVHQEQQRGQQLLQSQSSLMTHKDDSIIGNLFQRIKDSETTIQTMLINNQKLSRYSHQMPNNPNDSQNGIDPSKNLDEGSGSGMNPFTDDEDYFSEENSGDGPPIDTSSSKIPNSDIEFNPVNISPEIIKEKDTDSSGGCCSISNLLLTILLINSLLLFV